MFDQLVFHASSAGPKSSTQIAKEEKKIKCAMRFPQLTIKNNKVAAESSSTSSVDIEEIKSRLQKKLNMKTIDDDQPSSQIFPVGDYRGTATAPAEVTRSSSISKNYTRKPQKNKCPRCGRWCNSYQLSNVVLCIGCGERFQFHKELSKKT